MKIISKTIITTMFATSILTAASIYDLGKENFNKKYGDKPKKEKLREIAKDGLLQNPRKLNCYNPIIVNKNDKQLFSKIVCQSLTNYKGYYENGYMNNSRKERIIRWNGFNELFLKQELSQYASISGSKEYANLDKKYNISKDWNVLQGEYTQRYLVDQNIPRIKKLWIALAINGGNYYFWKLLKGYHYRDKINYFTIAEMLSWYYYELSRVINKFYSPYAYLIYSHDYNEKTIAEKVRVLEIVENEELQNSIINNKDNREIAKALSQAIDHLFTINGINLKR